MERIRLGLAITAVALGLASPLGVYPIFQSGYWNLVDSSFMAILLSGILSAGWIVWSSVGPGSGSIKIPTSALLLIVLAVAGGLASFNAEFPFVALLGTYQSGYGPVWHLVAALLTIVMCNLLRRKRSLQRINLIVIAVMIGLSATLLYTFVTSDFVLIPSTDSYGLIGFFALFVPSASWPNKAAERLNRWVLRVSAVGLIALSQNMTLIGLLSAGLCIWLFLHIKSNIRPSLGRIGTWPLALLIILFSTAPLAFILSDYAGFAGQTLRMRAVIADIMVAAFQHSDWVDLIIGQGWGHTQSAFYQYLHWGNIALYTQKWDFLWRDMFHSHNFLIETVYSVGVLGTTSMLAFLVTIYTGAGSHMKIAALALIFGYVLYSSVWYELAFHVPYLALALAAIRVTPEINETDLNIDEEKVDNNRTAAATLRWPLVALSASSILALGTSLVSFSNFSAQVFEMKPDQASTKTQAYADALFPPDPRKTDFARSMLYRDFLRNIKRTDTLHNTEGIEKLNGILAAIGHELPTTRSPELILVGLEIFNTITFIPEWAWAKKTIDGKQSVWKEFVWKSLALAPYRSDVLIPYLTQLLIRRDHRELDALVSSIQLNRPEDPIGLYYKGALQSQSPDNKVKLMGLSNIAKALDCGINLFMEIPQWLVTRVVPYRNDQADCPVETGIGKS